MIMILKLWNFPFGLFQVKTLYMHSTIEFNIQKITHIYLFSKNLLHFSKFIFIFMP